jgi:SufS family cysteine desulfurase
MNTTGSNGAATAPAASPPRDEAAHSNLVAQLVAEAFSGFAKGAKPPATLPEVPAETPAAPRLPNFASTDPPSKLPPVHPNAQPSRPDVAQEGKTPSGAHSPQSGDSYAFGEPRCNGLYRPQNNKPNTKTANSNPLLGFSQAESMAPPDFYFLRGRQVSGKSPVSCQSYPNQAGPIPNFDIEGVRRDFPALHQLVNGQPLIWLDNAATTHKPQAVIDATSQFYSRDNSNIHRAAHALATRSTELFEAGREKVRKFLGAADAKEIVFVRGTTEAINLVAQSYGGNHIGTGDEIIVSELEHHANIVPWQLLAEKVGATLRVIPINDRGELILEEYVKLLGPRTKFVSVAHVSNSLGTITPVEQIIALAHARGVPVLVDGAQSTPHLPVNVTALDADFYVFSGHKVFAPTGIGALYGKAPLLEAMPPWQGGGHMIKDVRFEKTTYQHAPEKFEAGTPDIAGVVGLGAAIDYLFKIGIPAIAAYEHALLEYATRALGTIPGLRPIGTAASKASVLSFVIPGLSNESIARHLDKNGIAVRAGHHCAQPAIWHFGLENSLRPSLAFYNTREEVDALARALRALKRNV